MNNQRKQAAKNFLKMLLEQDIPLRDGHEEDKIVLCLGLVVMLDPNEETMHLAHKLKDKFSHQEIQEGMNAEFSPYVIGILSNFDPSILESAKKPDSPRGIQEIIVEEL